MKLSVRSYGFASSVAACLLLAACAGGPNQESTGQYIDSAATTAKVKAALMSDSDVKGLDVHVNTYKGVVDLSGFVNSQDQKKRAEDLAWGVPTVKGVKNDLVVKANAEKAVGGQSATQSGTSGQQTSSGSDTTTSQPPANENNGGSSTTTTPR